MARWDLTVRRLRFLATSCKVVSMCPPFWGPLFPRIDISVGKAGYAPVDIGYMIG
jgi:hypothetical protein